MRDSGRGALKQVSLPPEEALRAIIIVMETASLYLYCPKRRLVRLARAAVNRLHSNKILCSAC